MTWSIRLVQLSSVIFSMQIIFSVEQAATPWESVQLAEGFIANFLTAVAHSNAFSSGQQDDMSIIRKTVTTAMEKFNSSNTTPSTKFQALNMLFASALAEIIAAEEGVNIELKTNTIENALSSAYLETIGIINTQFVTDIKNLIYILAYTAANRVSTASLINVGGYKQRSLRQLAPFSSTEVMKINGSVPPRGPGTEQQRSPILDSSQALNVPDESQGSSQHTTTEQRARVSSVAYSQSSSGSESQKSLPQVSSAQDQQGSSGNRKGVVLAGETGEGLGPAKQLSYISGVNRLQQQGSGGNKQIGQESTSQGKSGVISQKPGSDRSTAFTTTASGSYGVGNVTLGLQGPSEIEAKGSSIQQPYKSGNKRSGAGTRASASVAVDENGLGSNAKKRLEKESPRLKEQEKSARGSSEAVDQRLEAFKSDNYGWSAATSVSETVAGRPEESKGPNGKYYKELYGSREISEATGSYVASNRADGYQQEGKYVEKSTKTAGQDERGTQAHSLTGQIPGKKGQYGTVYQKAGLFGGKASVVYSMGTAATASADEYRSSSSVRESGGQAPSGQRSSDVTRQGLDTQKQPETESQSANPKDYGNHMVSATSAAGSSYELSSSAKRLQQQTEQGLSNNGSAKDESNSYTSGTATAIAAGGYRQVGPTIPPNIPTSNDSSEISSSVSSSVPGSSAQPSPFLNSVTSIVSHVRTANPNLSNCNVLIQTLLEIISTLVDLLRSCNIGQFNFDTSNQYALMTRQSATKDNNEHLQNSLVNTI